MNDTTFYRRMAKRGIPAKSGTFAKAIGEGFYFTMFLMHT
jgi:hypothetical protein